jgi:hypothetical protein
MQKAVTLGSAIALSLVLTACGGGGADDSNTNAGGSGGQQPTTNNPSTTDAQVVAYVKSSNIDFSPGANGRPAGTWRWSGTPSQHVLVYVPAPATGNATEQDYAAKVKNSIAQINAKLTGLLVLEATSSAPTNSNYIQISYGTSYVPAGSTNYAGFCANVSTGPNLGNMILPDSQNGIATSPVYVNLGNGHCDVTQDIVTHEFGHALGLANHFEGFGTGDSISTAYWDVLATLYGNPQSMVATSLTVKRAAM